MAWLRRIGLLGVFLFAGPNFITTSAGVQTITVSSVTTNISLGSQLKMGTPITWTVTASGGSAPLQYQYWICDTVVGWQLMQGYSTSNVFTFVPQQAGNYAFSVYIRSAGSASVGEVFPPYDYFTVGRTGTDSVHIDRVETSPSIGDTVPLNQTIRFTPKGSGVNTAMFQYYVNEGSGWIYKGGYTSGYLDYAPAQPGPHVLRIYARPYGSSGDPEDVTYVNFTAGAWPATGPLSDYMDAGAALDPKKTCSPGFLPAFTGAGLQGEVTRRDPITTKTLTYVWDWPPVSKLRAEKDQFGYLPQYLPGRVSFATNGRPMIRGHDDLLTLNVLGNDGTWAGVSFFNTAKDSLTHQGFDWQKDGTGPTARYFIGDFAAESRVVFDKTCNAYAIIDAVGARMFVSGQSTPLHFSILMHSMDGGRHWKAYPIPPIPGLADYAVNMEVPTTGHMLDGPPALLIHPRWYNQISFPALPPTPTLLRLVTIAPASDGTVTLSGPYPISDNSISGAGIAGSENYVVSAGNVIHIVYPGATLQPPDPACTPAGTIPCVNATPAYAVTCTRNLQSLTCTTPTFLGVGINGVAPFVLDDHNQPVIARDSQGYLHVMLGGHNGPLNYRRSKYKDNTSEWNDAEPVGRTPTEAKYSYPSLIIDRFDVPVIAARSAVGTVYKLIAMRRTAAAPHWNWQDEQTLLDPIHVFYSNWYHKLSLDPAGGVFLSYGWDPGDGEYFVSDEVEVLNNTYNWGMQKLDPACQPTDHTARPATACRYSGAKTVNLSVLAADINQDWSNVKFELATSGSFAGMGPRVWLDTTNANAAFHTVDVSWAGVAAPTLNDWIGLFPVGNGSGDQNWVSYASTAKCTPGVGCVATSAGHMTLAFPSAGTYEVRLFSNAQSIAASKGFTATQPPPPQ